MSSILIPKLLLYLLSVLLIPNVVDCNTCGTRHTIEVDDREVMYLISCGDDNDITGTYPLVVSMHCYGGRHYNEIDRYESILSQYGKAILVSPQGMGRSWNAVECCGTAAAHNLDDVGFIDKSINEIIKITNGIHNGQIATTGFSNGGFMSMHMTQYSSHRIVAAASMSGYRYERPIKSTPVLLHHSLNDDKVLSTGCCSTSVCCCGISSSSCRSISDWFLMWSSINSCMPSTRTAVTMDMTCQYSDCFTTTILCKHNYPVHFDWAKGSPNLSVEKNILRFIFDEFCKDLPGCYVKQHSP